MILQFCCWEMLRTYNYWSILLLIYLLINWFTLFRVYTKLIKSLRWSCKIFVFLYKKMWQKHYKKQNNKDSLLIKKLKSPLLHKVLFTYLLVKWKIYFLKSFRQWEIYPQPTTTTTIYTRQWQRLIAIIKV